MSLAVYALSADPITKGHVDVIERAAKVFDKLIVAIGINLKKNYTFTLMERTFLAQQSLAHLKNVSVLSFEGLLVDFAYEVGATVLVRGVRNTKDLEFEQNLCWLGGSQKLELETVLLFTKPELTQVSSSAVKELQSGQGLIHDYVPLGVKQALEQKLSSQFFLGITGEIGVGKTYVAGQLAELAHRAGIEVHQIELDGLGHEILEQLTEPKYHQLRAELVTRFGTEICPTNGKISRQVLGEIVFNDPVKLAVLNKLMRAPILVKLRRASYGKKGLILISGALLAEAEMLPLVNNQVLLVTATTKDQHQRLTKRGLTSAQISIRVQAQATTAQKQKLINHAISQDRFGQLWTIVSDQTLSQTLPEIFKSIKTKMKSKT